MKQNKFLTTQIITRDAMLAAVCAVLGYIALDLGNLKVTFESFPVLLGGFLFGPIEGMIIGGIGTFVYQILRYGISLTTFLWILPYLLCGLFTGLLFARNEYRYNPKRILFIIFIMEIMIFLINTGVIYIDSKIYGYYTFAYVFGSILIRAVICAVKSFAFGLIMPMLLRNLKGVTRVRKNGL